MVVKVTRSFATTLRGIGKPDYTREVSLGQIRPGISLKYNQTLKQFTRTFSAIASPFVFVTAPLAPGGIAHAIDAETNLALPYNLAQGYILSGISASQSALEDSKIWAYFDGWLVATLGFPAAGIMFYSAPIIGAGTDLLDPTGALPHTFDITITNQGAGNLEGGFSIFLVLEAVGTPPLPTTKTIRCKFCGHEETVPKEVTTWVCPKCEKLNIYLDLSKFRRT